MAIISNETKTLINDIISIEETYSEDELTMRKDVYLATAEQLKIDGILQHKISAKIISLITAKLQERSDTPIPRWHNGYFNRVMSEYKYVDLSYDHRSDPSGDRENTSDFDPSGDRENTSSDNATLHPNQALIDIYKRIITLCELGLRKAVTIDKPILGDDIKSKNEFLQQTNTIIGNCEAALNEKTKVPTNVELILLTTLASEASVNLAAKKFLQYRLVLFEELNKFLTRKQALKFLKNANPILPIFKPHNQSEALFMGYIGNHCTKCDSFCMRESEDDLHVAECQDCHNQIKIKTILRCRHCHNLIDSETNQCINPDCKIKIPQQIVNKIG